jgi:hypothetical protein
VGPEYDEVVVEDDLVVEEVEEPEAVEIEVNVTYEVVTCLRLESV